MDMTITSIYIPRKWKLMIETYAKRLGVSQSEAFREAIGWWLHEFEDLPEDEMKEGVRGRK